MCDSDKSTCLFWHSLIPAPTTRRRVGIVPRAALWRVLTRGSVQMRRLQDGFRYTLAEEDPLLGSGFYRISGVETVSLALYDRGSRPAVPVRVFVLVRVCAFSVFSPTARSTSPDVRVI